VLDAEGIGRARFWGYSLGGYVGFALGAWTPERVASLVLGGTHPFAEDVPPEHARLRGRLGVAGPPDAGSDAGALLALDGAAVAAAWEAGREDPGLADALPGILAPALIYYGTDDYPDHWSQQAAESMPDATVVALEGLNHPQAFRRSDLVLPHVRSFLDRVVSEDGD
jgi:pimeloyl-ACP methyl ester carboxylesterase